VRDIELTQNGRLERRTSERCFQATALSGRSSVRLLGWSVDNLGDDIAEIDERIELVEPLSLQVSISYMMAPQGRRHRPTGEQSGWSMGTTIYSKGREAVCAQEVRSLEFIQGSQRDQISICWRKWNIRNNARVLIFK